MMDVLIQRIDGEITVTVYDGSEEEEVAQFVDTIDPLSMLEGALAGLGHNVDIIDRDTEEEEEDPPEEADDEEIS
jgi:hypothetical protein